MSVLHVRKPEPIVFVREKNELLHVIDVTIDSERELSDPGLTLEAGGKRYEIAIGGIQRGEKTYWLRFPETPRAGISEDYPSFRRACPWRDAAVFPGNPTKHWRLHTMQGSHVTGY